MGLSISDGDMAIDALAFARYLRGRGFSGHVTSGGTLATLIRHELLERHPGIDSVIRHAGEIPIVELTGRLATGASLEGVPGMTTREGDGAPAPVDDPMPLRLHPKRKKKLTKLLGVPSARLLASRGCPGRCPYCGPAALQREAVEEGVRAGIDRNSLVQQGIGSIRRRQPADVADEVAWLYRRKAARMFLLLDDNLLSAGRQAD